MNKEFIRVRSTKDIIISVGLIAAGGILVALPTATSINILGFFMIFAGILLFLMLRSGYKDQESGVPYCKKEFFFSQNERVKLSESIASKPSSISLAEEDKGNAVRLDVFYSQKSGRAYVQLFEYIPYKYEPCSRQFEYPISEVNNLIK